MGICYCYVLALTNHEPGMSDAPEGHATGHTFLKRTCVTLREPPIWENNQP